jgi:O-antigen ligase
VTRWRTVKESILGPALVIAYPVLFALFMAATFFVQRLKKMVWGGQNTQFSNDGRHEQVQKGMPLIWSHPWGYGIGQGAGALDYHNEAGVLTIDTYYLLTALDYGILGFLVYYAAILVVIYNCARWGLEDKPREKEETQLIPIGIALTAFFVIKSIFSQTENHTLQYMMMGMAAALIYRIQRRQGLVGPPKPKLKFPKQAMRLDPGADVKPRA